MSIPPFIPSNLDWSDVRQPLSRSSRPSSSRGCSSNRSTPYVPYQHSTPYFSYESYPESRSSSSAKSTPDVAGSGAHTIYYLPAEGSYVPAGVVVQHQLFPAPIASPPVFASDPKPVHAKDCSNSLGLMGIPTPPSSFRKEGA